MTLPFPLYLLTQGLTCMQGFAMDIVNGQIVGVNLQAPEVHSKGSHWTFTFGRLLEHAEVDFIQETCLIPSCKGFLNVCIGVLLIGWLENGWPWLADWFCSFFYQGHLNLQKVPKGSDDHHVFFVCASSTLRCTLCLSQFSFVGFNSRDQGLVNFRHGPQGCSFISIFCVHSTGFQANL